MTIRTKTHGLLWTREEDEVLIANCQASLNTNGNLQRGCLSEALRLFPHRTYASVKHRVYTLVSQGKAPKSWTERHSPLPLPKWSEAEAGWMAGIFDGEGSLSIWTPKGTTHKRISFVLCYSTDDAIAARVMRLAGHTLCQHIARKDRPQHHKPCYQLVVKRQADVRELMLRMMPHVTHIDKLRKMAEAISYIEGRLAC